MKTHFFSALSLLCSLCAPSELIAATIIGLDLEALPGGEVLASDLARARMSDSASAAAFTLHAKIAPKAEVVEESDGRRALRLFAPAPSEDSAMPSIFFGFRDPQLAELLSAETPVLIQTTLRAGSGQCAVVIEAIFVKGDVIHPHALFRTHDGKSEPPQLILDLPVGEPVKVSAVLSSTEGSIQITMTAEGKDGVLEQKDSFIETNGWGLQDLAMVHLIFGLADQPPDKNFLDVLAFEVSQ